MLGIGLSLANAAKSLFSGEGKAARQERRATKKAAKEAAKDAKELAKKAITGGGTAGAKAGQVFASITTWFKNNWQTVAIVAGAIVTIVVLFKMFGKKTRVRRRTGSRGSSAMKARMAKVRAARRRKRK